MDQEKAEARYDDDEIKSNSNEDSTGQSGRQTSLIAYVTRKTDSATDFRDQNYLEKWNEYYRLWRGVWTSEDATRSSERSKIIVPALQQAVEATVAELEEGAFGKGRYIEVEDDADDQQRDDFASIQAKLEEDLDKSHFKQNCSEIFLNGALYGTGIGKIVVEWRKDYSPKTNEMGELSVSTEKVPCVKLESVSPRHFFIDPAARNLAEAMYCGQEIVMPASGIIAKQKSGEYYDVDVGAWDESNYEASMGEFNGNDESEDRIKIIEFHGLVPVNLLPKSEQEDEDDTDLVEAIITIANDGYVLKEVANPFAMKDRGFVAYQHDIVPDRFWGRGVCEKGYNPQKALDAELRARIDGLALTVHPMMAGDATRLPRGTDLSVRPGKSILTNGDPKTILNPMNFGTIDPNIFRDSADLERMIQMGTGAIDSATPISMNPRNQTATGMSMIQSGVIKRSKRTMQNIERGLLVPSITKILWRYMDIYPERYPVRDYKFKVTASLGIVAREFETAQLTQLLQTVPPDSPVYLLVLKALFTLSSLSSKEEILSVVNQMIQSSLNPQPPQPDVDQQLKMADLQERQRNNRAKEDIERGRIRAQMAMDLIDGGKKENVK